MKISILKGKKEDVSALQLNCLNKIHYIFIEEKLNNLIVDNYYFIGVRGNYEGKENYCLHFSFNYYSYYIEFYLCYDQLEYYISKENRTLKECNLEDFWKDDIMVNKFIDYLKRDLKKLNIPFQNKE